MTTDEAHQEITSLITNKIYDTLMGQRFADWHNGKFQDYVTGDLAHELGVANSTAETLIKQDIQNIFHL